MAEAICVYCSSSSAVPQVFLETAEELGKAISSNGFTLVYGGVDVGLMGVVAKTVKAHHGRVVGVIPRALVEKGLDSRISDEVVVAEDLRERKAVMEQRADAFICLPGGFGTLEELLEVLTLKQLHMHNKPIVLLDVEGAFEGLIRQFEYGYDRCLIKPEYRELYFVTDSVDEAISYITGYVPKVFADKWF
jgi:uncharacterized protein (TIGR00730 family)